MPRTVELEDDPGIQKRVDGRSKEARTARAAAEEQAAIKSAANRGAEIEKAQEAVAARRAPPSTQGAARRGNATAMGRDGEVLSRKRTGTSDPFAIDPKIIPQGWDYQWNAITVVGNAEVLMDQNLQMAENGWRPVPAERHPGRFMPAGHKGSIVRGGQRLEERPLILSEEARAEDLRKARQLVADRNESLKLVAQQGMRGGFEMGGQRGTGPQTRMTIDHGTDIPQPSYTLAEPGE